MTRFTARAFRRKISRKAKKSKGARKTRKVKTQKGGNTYDRSIPNAAVKANPMEWDD